MKMEIIFCFTTTVFAAFPIDAGFSAPSRIHSSQGGRGNVQRAHATFPNGRRKTQRIAHGAAPCGHHHGRSCQTMPLKQAQKLVDGIPRFQAFSSAHRHLNDGTGHGVFHVLQTVSQQVLRAGFFMHPKDPIRIRGAKGQKP